MKRDNFEYPEAEGRKETVTPHFGAQVLEQTGERKASLKINIEWLINILDGHAYWIETKFGDFSNKGIVHFLPRTKNSWVLPKFLSKDRALKMLFIQVSGSLDWDHWINNTAINTSANFASLLLVSLD